MEASASEVVHGGPRSGGFRCESILGPGSIATVAVIYGVWSDANAPSLTP